MSGPLEGIRILEWGIWHQPASMAMLGDLGAEVIKIEERERGDPLRGQVRAWGLPVQLPGGRVHNFEMYNRNKKSLAIDLKKPEGREVIYRLVKKSDVFMQNFRQGVAARLGMDYPTLSQHNPRLIYASSSGFGRRGEESQRGALDILALARSGAMMSMGEPDMPPLMFVGAIADQIGATTLAYGVLAALVARERKGIGQEVDASLLGSMIALQAGNVTASLLLGKQFPRHQRSKAGNPMTNFYRCKDGRWMALAHLQQERYWSDFCRALGAPQLEKDPRFDDARKRADNAEELVPIIDGVFATRTYDEWAKIFREIADFNFCPVNQVSDLPSDPQVIANDYIVDFDHPVLGPIKMVGVPVELSRTPGSVRLPAPELGQHTEEILLEIAGYTWPEITELKEREVI